MNTKKAPAFKGTQDFIDYIKIKWANEIISVSSTYANEIHLNVDLSNIVRITTELNQEFGFPLIQLLANDERENSNNFKLYYTFAYKYGKFIVVIAAPVDEKDCRFPSITPHIPAAHWYEREIRDMFGLEPIGHPDIRRLVLHKDWPKGVYPMRREFSREQQVPRIDGQFSFDNVEGEGVIQIPVGPIHAGIIEPGHFRFSAVGENIINLEARLFYTHRGIEKTAENKDPEQGLLIAERICGACSFSHSTAYCQAIEKLTNTQTPDRAKFIRTIASEMERLYNHIGDVGNICAGIGFAFGTMHGARLKEQIMNLNEIVFGSRFLRGINTPGGVRRDISQANRQLILDTLTKVEKDFREITEILVSTDAVLDRFEGTGILNPQLAIDLHAVGPAARAVGVDRDTRRDQPYAAYERVIFSVPVYRKGDVLARIKIRIDETFESFDIIKQALDLIPPGELKVSLGDIVPYSHATSITESARGENVHFIMFGPNGTIYRYMVRSASYCNWPVLPTTVPGNIVPDFPLINKSFELCYSCLDR